MTSKNLAVLAACLLAGFNAAAQSEADAQRMMERMQEMQACMADVDQAKVQAMQQEAEAMQREIDALCQAGKRDEAQHTAIRYGREIAGSPEMKKMRKCSALMEGVMPQMPVGTMPDVEESEKKHICD